MALRLSWKALFYNQIMPQLARIDAQKADLYLQRMGCLVQNGWGPRRRTIHGAVQRARAAVEIPESEVPTFRSALGANTARMLARDYLLGDQSDRQVEQRFHVQGFECLLEALAQRDGVIILGSHLGAYIPALHWLYRQDLPLRSMIQRPRHVSSYLHTQLDHPSQLLPSSSLFLCRNLSPRDATERILRARNVLREGMSLYLCGDITNTEGRAVSWFGQPASLLDHWTYLAASTGAWVVPLFARFEPGGRYSLQFTTPFQVETENTQTAVSHYLQHLTQHVAASPAQAVPYWTWPTYPGAPPESAQLANPTVFKSGNCQALNKLHPSPGYGSKGGPPEPADRWTARV